MTCTCYKGHQDDLNAITTSIANCAVHGNAAPDTAQDSIERLARYARGDVTYRLQG
jgi:hypothetical protein